MTKQANASRILYLDNVKTFIIFLVVLYHAGWVYEKSGILSSVWIVDDPAKVDLAGILNMILDIFMMPTLFFISGYFTSLSLKSKTGWSFIRSRLKRLMLPWLIAVLVLIPLYKVIFLSSRNLPQQNLGAYFHITGGSLINQGWLWFLPLLFCFDLLYLFLSRSIPWKVNFKLTGIVVAIFLLNLFYSIGMQVFGAYGWTKTMLLDFQNERLLIYFLIFLLGAYSQQQKLLEREPGKRIPYYVICATIWIPINFYVIFLLNLIFNPGHYIISGLIDVIIAWTGFHLSLFGLLYLVMATFRFYLNRQGSFLSLLNRQSYGVYILHFIVMGLIAFIMLDMMIPAVAKYIVLTIITFAVSTLLVMFYHQLVPKLLKTRAS